MTYTETLNIPSNYEQFKRNPEKVDFALQEAISFLKSIDSANDVITSRSITILGIIIAAIITLITYGFSGGLSGDPDPLKISAILIAFRLYWIAKDLSLNIKTQSTPPVGDEPNTLVNNKTCSESMSLTELIVLCINDYQNRISLAKQSNNKQSLTLNSCINKLLFVPAEYILIFLLVECGLFVYFQLPV